MYEFSFLLFFLDKLKTCNCVDVYRLEIMVLEMRKNNRIKQMKRYSLKRGMFIDIILQ